MKEVNVYPGDLRELVIEPGEELDADTAVYMFCPAHQDKSRPSLRVYPNGAHCFTCGVHYHRDEFCALFDTRHVTSTKLRSFRHSTRKPPPLLEVPPAARGYQEGLWTSPERDRILEYLESRGITSLMMQQYMLGHNGVAFTLPIWESFGGPLYSIRFRRDDAFAPQLMKYWGLRGRNDLRLYPWRADEQRIILTEGEFDALLLRRYGLPAYSWTNGASSIPTVEQWHTAAPNIRKVVLIRDQDPPGIQSTAAIITVLDEMGVGHEWVTWPYDDAKDVTELWQKHSDIWPNAIEEFKQRLERNRGMVPTKRLKSDQPTQHQHPHL